MWWEIYFILVVSIVCTGIQLSSENLYEESDATAEVHPRYTREERRIPEWSQFFYLRTPDRRDKPKGFAYHVPNGNIHRSGPYPFPINRERPEFLVNDRRPHNIEPPKLLRRWHLRDSERDSGRSSESSEETPNMSLEKESENNRRELESRPSSRHETKHSSRLSNEPERESETQYHEREGPVSNRQSSRQDSRNSRWHSVFHDPTVNQKSSSRLTQGQNRNDNSNLPFPEGDEVPETISTPGEFPPRLQGTPYGVVDTYLQFPPISFRFHISPRVHVLRPTDVMINQPIGNGFRPLLPFENTTSHSLGDGGRVRVHVVAVGHGMKDEDSIFPPPRQEQSNTKTDPTTETEDLTTPKTSTIIQSLSQQKQQDHFEKLTESTTVTPEVTSALTTTTTTSTDTETPTTETTTITETTSQPTTTTTRVTTLEETSSVPTTTTEKFMLEIKTTPVPDTDVKKEDQKDQDQHTAKTPCNHTHQPSTQPLVPTTEEISTATSVVETRVDIKTTSAVSEHLESHSTRKSSNEGANNRNEKNNIVFMAAENLELW